jgi:hypothetical protein
MSSTKAIFSHNHFVATSELLSPSVSFLAVTSTSNYFSLILKSITFHLKKFTRLSEESQQLLFEWLSSIVSAFECKREHLNKIEILDLRITLLEMFADFDLKQAPELLKSFSNVLHRLNVFAILKDFEESSSIDRFTARIVRNAGLFDFSDFRGMWILTR